MQITFDTTTLTKDEALGLFALLDTLQPGAFDPGPELTIETARAIDSAASEYFDFVGESAKTIMEEISKSHVEELTSAPDLDSRGLPWHEEIHASSKATNADGTWRTKRGVDKALVERIEATLRESSVAETVETVLEATGGELSVDESGSFHMTAPTPPAPPAPSATLVVNGAGTGVTGTGAPMPPTTTAVSPFVALMKRVTTAQGSGKLTPVRVKELLESIDKKGIMDLRTDDDALASFAVLLDGEGV